MKSAKGSTLLPYPSSATTPTTATCLTSPLRNGKKINFDHPDALETDLLVEHLVRLRAGEAVDVPVYDFSTHTRTEEGQRLEAARIVILDGMLVLADVRIREILDVKVFVDTDADIRFIRRMRRDIRERGRSVESIVDQYQLTVRPMHLAFVEGSRTFADIVIPGEGRNRGAIDHLVSRLKSMV